MTAYPAAMWGQYMYGEYSFSVYLKTSLEELCDAGDITNTSDIVGFVQMAKIELISNMASWNAMVW